MSDFIWTRAAFLIAFISSIIATCGTFKEKDTDVLQELKSLHKVIEQSEIPELIKTIILKDSICLDAIKATKKNPQEPKLQ